jgi:Kef-type K+ transport system membrane component KefB
MHLTCGVVAAADTVVAVAEGTVGAVDTVVAVGAVVVDDAVGTVVLAVAVVVAGEGTDQQLELTLEQSETVGACELGEFCVKRIEKAYDQWFECVLRIVHIYNSRFSKT